MEHKTFHPFPGFHSSRVSSASASFSQLQSLRQTQYRSHGTVECNIKRTIFKIVLVIEQKNIKMYLSVTNHKADAEAHILQKSLMLT